MRQIEVSERVFTQQVIDVARLGGWRTAHFRAGMTRHGWRTPVAGDAEGFPDLVLVRECMIFAELKRKRGKLRAKQQEWLDALRAAGVECHVWRPTDWEEIERRLLRRKEELK